MPLNGTLQTLGLADLIQLQASQSSSSQVRLTRPGGEGALWFANGDLVRASYGSLEGENALYELLTWEDGEFLVMDAEEPLPARNIHTPWTMLVLEALHRIDEARASGTTTPQAILHRGAQRQVFRRAVLVGEGGDLTAEVPPGSGEADAALTSFLVSRAKAIAESMNFGPFQRLVSSNSSGKLCVETLPDAYLGCWMDERTPLEPVQALARAVQDKAQT